MGTTRMDDSSRRGVVDRHGRMHDLHNLYVAGSSVFPTAGANYPTITLVALALRLSDHIAVRVAKPVAAAQEAGARAAAPSDAVLVRARS
jgi:choline dehydrogenase-like flavoprotein